MRVIGEVGELSITRAFGDKNYKEFIDCEPDIYQIDYNNDQIDFIIMATDGF